jgi:hypothetical protein
LGSRSEIGSEMLEYPDFCDRFWKNFMLSRGSCKIRVRTVFVFERFIRHGREVRDISYLSKLVAASLLSSLDGGHVLI